MKNTKKIIKKIKTGPTRKVGSIRLLAAEDLYLPWRTAAGDCKGLLRKPSSPPRDPCEVGLPCSKIYVEEPSPPRDGETNRKVVCANAFLRFCDPRQWHWDFDREKHAIKYCCSTALRSDFESEIQRLLALGPVYL